MKTVKKRKGVLGRSGLRRSRLNTRTAKGSLIVVGMRGGRQGSVSEHWNRLNNVGIVGSIPLLIKGSHWRVGEGKWIQIIKDRWLPEESSFCVLSESRSLPENTLMSELIANDGCCWRVELVERIFPPKVAEAILGAIRLRL
ncbi:hypothetical protein Salat_1473800 [Sesamum alatum]|uniref:Uncharacterized protein n=1 Tax=Sesamum alatum TaxID=300844 RepID=A0AAE1YBM2_9LAMI|nr:hypothetical protein Salat_1473800 [Sesamum alatum]